MRLRMRRAPRACMYSPCHTFHAAAIFALSMRATTLFSICKRSASSCSSRLCSAPLRLSRASRSIFFSRRLHSRLPRREPHPLPLAVRLRHRRLRHALHRARQHAMSRLLLEALEPGLQTRNLALQSFLVGCGGVRRFQHHRRLSIFLLPHLHLQSHLFPVRHAPAPLSPRRGDVHVHHLTKRGGHALRLQNRVFFIQAVELRRLGGVVLVTESVSRRCTLHLK